jgi:predicted methyltransferase
MIRLSLLTVLAASLAIAQVPEKAAEKVNERYQTPEGRATIAKTLSAPTRDQLQRPAELVKAIGVKPGMTVADVGTGVGYMLPFLSAGVGAQGHVVAEDIFKDFLDKARAHASEAGLTNVEFVQGDEHSAKLAAGKFDVILTLDAYHHFNYPQEMLAGFKAALKPGGRLAIVEYYKREGAMNGQSALTHIRLDDAGVVKEVEAAGFKLIEEREQIPKSQYIALFGVR